MAKNAPVNVFFDKDGYVKKCFDMRAARNWLDVRYGSAQYLPDGHNTLVVDGGKIIATIRKEKK